MRNVNTSGARKHALRRLSSLGAAVATAVTMLFIVATNASASPVTQFDFRAIICPILLFLKAAFGPFFGGIFDGLLAAFGCTTPSG